MSDIVYENEAAVLTFTYQELVKALEWQIIENEVEDESKLLNWLKKNSGQGKKDIRLKEDKIKRPEYLSRIIYLVSYLLSEKMGQVFCKECCLNIPPAQIKVEKTTPFDFQKGMDKKTLKEIQKELGLKPPLRMSGSGGTQFTCPQSHFLLSTIDWII
jgi:hypothetical protein